MKKGIESNLLPFLNIASIAYAPFFFVTLAVRKAGVVYAFQE
jgi:hypothetical protein